MYLESENSLHGSPSTVTHLPTNFNVHMADQSEMVEEEMYTSRYTM